MKIIYSKNKAGNIFEILVDDDLFEGLSKFKWRVVETHRKFYAERDSRLSDNIGKRKIYMHRDIMEVNDRNIVIDHIDHNGLNNQKSNLRLCLIKENCRNQKESTINSSSKYKGVSKSRTLGTWRSRLMLDRKEIYLGNFNNEIEAAKAYDRAALKYFGEFACLNFPELIDEYKAENK